MSESWACPNCGTDRHEGWNFHTGDSNPDDGQLEPDEGGCDECGFCYSQHVLYPIKEQVAAFRENRTMRAIDLRTGKVVRESD